MFCQQCNAELPAKAQVCFFCGEKVPPITHHHPYQKCAGNLPTPLLLPSPQCMREITSSSYGGDEPTFKDAQKRVTDLVTSARTSVVTYETLFAALTLDCTYHNRFITELCMYYDAYDLFTEYSYLLWHRHDEETLFSQFHMVRVGSLQKALDSLGVDTNLTRQVLSYPGFRQWIAGWMLTSVFMDILSLGLFEKIAQKDVQTIDIAFRQDFWHEQLILAKKAIKYVVPETTTTSQDAIESFIHAHQSLVTTHQKEQLRRALLRQLAALVRAHSLSLPAAAAISQCVLGKIQGLTKAYELILVVDLIPAKWNGLSDLALETTLANE